MSKTYDFLDISKENRDLLGWVFWLVGFGFFLQIGCLWQFDFVQLIGERCILTWIKHML